MWLNNKSFIGVLLFCISLPLMAWQNRAGDNATNKLSIESVKPESCWQLQQKLTIHGQGLRTARELSLRLQVQRKVFPQETLSWSSKSITFVLPDIINQQVSSFEIFFIDNATGEQVSTYTPRYIWCEGNDERQEETDGEDPTHPTEEPAANKPDENRDNQRETARESQQPEVNRSGSLLGMSIPKPPTLTFTKQHTNTNDYEPRKILVVTHDMPTAIELANELRTLGIRIQSRKQLSQLGFVLNSFLIGKDDDIEATLTTIRENYPDLWSDVNQRYQLQKSVEKNTRGDLSGIPEKKRFAQPMIGWPDRGCSSSASIGMLDTTVNVQHPALSDVSITQYSAIPKRLSPVDDGHGTAIATLLVGKPTNDFAGGLLTDTTLMAANVFYLRDDEKESSVESILAGIDWLVGKSVKVVNMSFGGKRNLLLELAIERLHKKNIVVVAAAGNSGRDGEEVFPAAHESVIAVGAINRSKKRYRKGNTGEFIDIAAPGVSIWSADNTNKYKYHSGTSFAAPFVSAALLIKPWSSISGSTIDLGASGKDAEFGLGLLNVENSCH